MLDPAPPPEDHRGGAVAARRADAGDARVAVRRRRRRGAGDRLRRRRHGRVPRRRRRQLLLPRDEHPAAGRAPGHRVRHRPRPRRPAAARRRGRAAAAVAAGVRGHAIEVRLYAEDPAAGWQPQSGTLHAFDVPGVVAEFANPPAPGIRLDSGVVAGTGVGIHYDPMLAKVIAYAPTRAEAARALAGALARARIHGVVTNRDLLVRVLRHPAFLAGDTDTAFLDRHGLDALAEPLAGKDAYRLVGAGRRPRRRGAQPRRRRRARRASRAAGATCRARRSASATTGSGGELEVAYRLDRDGLVADGLRRRRPRRGDARTRSSLDVDGVTRRFACRRATATDRYVDSPLGSVTLRRVEPLRRPGRCRAPPARCWRRCRARSSASSSRSATASSAASRCCGWRR